MTLLVAGVVLGIGIPNFIEFQRNGAMTAAANELLTGTLLARSEALKAQKMFSSREWKRLYSDGTVAKWLQQVSDFFMSEAGVQKSTPATDYFDPALYLATIQ